MIIKGKKYLYTAGVMLYPELEMATFKKQSAQGWRFVRMTKLGILIFEQCPPQEQQFSVDFYDGEQSDLSDYLALYEEAGWQNVSNYHKKYYYFSAPLETAPIYTDSQSYRERIRKEWTWAILRSLVTLPIGLAILYLLTTTKHESANILAHKGLRFGLDISAFLLLIWPFSIILSLLFSRIVYRQRANYFGRPDAFAKKQRIMRDGLILAIIGAFIGGFVGYFRYKFF
ncbi:hypothetical protein BAU15_04020 [Enterococcus sp. JM4C]|uniref:DUF2812 domain-containing protein n=1 Tax=Candidatus Enterococcus huntleyi TaxID=1857217 RepID=UPI00137B0320|nr:DUF2812 domain-containing protein [Enterococcus sp. JM4C]KAF1295711.1 hypothetical protein BAU15_04020 [Enterococcus sp. JM4C]